MQAELQLNVAQQEEAAAAHALEVILMHAMLQDCMVAGTHIFASLCMLRDIDALAQNHALLPLLAVSQVLHALAQP